MSYRFTRKPLESGFYEPEGIYLSTPFTGEAAILQYWGERLEYYRQFTYNGVALKGYPGIRFAIEPDATLVSVDNGRITELSIEPGGFERYIKIEHRWGESVYAHIGNSEVDTGQMVQREQRVAGAEFQKNSVTWFHFSIRIFPYNRYDGWGGFTDPLPFIDPSYLQATDQGFADNLPVDVTEHPMSMIRETKSMRRP